MSDMSKMNRENRKRQLQNNIIQLPVAQARGYDDEEENREHVKRVNNFRRRRFMIATGAVLFLAVLGFAWYQYHREYEYTEYTVAWEKPMRHMEDTAADETPETATPAADSHSVSEGSFVKYEPFGSNMIRYTKDGATYYDASGKSVWTVSYEMKTPIINTNGDYAVIADQQGNDIYICSLEGNTGVAKTRLPITKTAVSAKGVTAAVVEDSTAAYIFYYKRDGEDLQISVKMLLSGDGYPVDVALSPDSQQIVMSVMYLKNGVMKNKVVFYDFSEIGKNVDNRFVGGFEEEFDDKMVGRIRYLNDETVCAFSDKGLTFISVKNVIPDPKVISVPVEEKIESICYTDSLAAVVVDNPSGHTQRIDVYKTDGTRAASVDFDFDYTGIELDENMILLYDENTCQVYNMNGNLKFNGQMDFQISMVQAKDSHSLVMAGSDYMKEIKLK